MSDAHADSETVRNGIRRVDGAPGAVDFGRASAQSGAARQFYYLRGEHQLYRSALRRSTVTSGMALLPSNQTFAGWSAQRGTLQANLSRPYLDDAD